MMTKIDVENFVACEIMHGTTKEYGCTKIKLCNFQLLANKKEVWKDWSSAIAFDSHPFLKHNGR